MTTNLTGSPPGSSPATGSAPPVLPFQVGITDEEIAEFSALAARVLRSGRLILGEQTEAFEAELAAAGVRHAVAVATGTVEVAGLTGGRRYPRADEFADRHLCLPLWRAIPDQDVARTLTALGITDAAGSAS